LKLDRLRWWFHLNIHFHVGSKQEMLSCPLNAGPSSLLATFGVVLLLTLALAGLVTVIVFPAVGVVVLVTAGAVAAYLKYANERHGVVS